MDAYEGLNAASNQWQAGSALTDYRERVGYDGNGNILTYQRNGKAQGARPAAMDNLSYHYVAGTNRLDHVDDAQSDVARYTEDIDDQNSGNYVYDAIGNLISDASEGLTSISWTVYGKIDQIQKSGKTISYVYDATGNRIGKSVTINNVTTSTWYVRDGSGNVMAVYGNKDQQINSGRLSQIEVDLYGNSRLGLWRSNRDVEQWPVPAGIGGPGLGGTQTAAITARGAKVYELTNHPGNVLTTVSDRRLEMAQTGNTALIDYYRADVVSATDYYPFGMQMPGRAFQIDNYRYGFNGQERSVEIESHSLVAEFWQYDSRIGRRWNTDPVIKEYESPYACFSDNPILLADPRGNDATDPTDPKGNKLILPDNAIITSTRKPSVNYTVDQTDNVPALAADGSVTSFMIGDRFFEARFDMITGEFTRYADEQEKTYDVNVFFYVTKHTPSMSSRIWGAVKFVGGGAEMFVGGAFGFATSWTGGGAVVGGVVILHGADGAAAGLSQMISGEETYTYTEKAIMMTGASPEIAGGTNALITTVLTAGSSPGGLFSSTSKYAATIKSSVLGRVIGWGEGATQEAVDQTIALTNNLTKSQINQWSRQGLTKEWVTKQLEAYNKAIEKGGMKMNNINLIPRKELMEKILELWK